MGVHNGSGKGGDGAMRFILLACWGLILAKVAMLVLGQPSPTYLEVSYIVAFPVALWNLKRGRELLGGWFFVVLLLVLGAGAGAWIVHEWQVWFDRGNEAAMKTPWLVGSTILALNFFLLLFFVGRELLADPAVKVDEPAPNGSPS